MKFPHMDHLNLNGNQIIIQLQKIKYFMKKELYNKDNNEKGQIKMMKMIQIVKNVILWH